MKKQNIRLKSPTQAPQVRNSKQTRTDFLELLRCYNVGKTKINKVPTSESNESLKLSYLSEEFDSPKYSRMEFESAPQTKEEVLAILKPLKLSKKCFMQKLARIGAMCSLYNCFRDLTVLNISQTSPHLLKVFKSTQLIHKTIKQSIQIGLLKCVDNHFSKKKHICKKYLWNIEVKRIVLDLVQEYGINLHNKFNTLLKNAKNVSNFEIIDETVLNENFEKFGDKNFVEKTFNVDFSAGLRIAGCSDEQAKYLLYKKYPQLEYFQKMIDEDNIKFLSSEEDKIHQSVFIPKIKRSKYKNKKEFITGISIREHNDFNQLHSRKNLITRLKMEGMDVSESDIPLTDKDGNEWREDYLKKYFNDKGIEFFTYFDQKASIFTIQKFKNTGIWCDEDMYEELFGGELSKEERRLFKLIFPMRGFFDWSARAIATKFKYEFGKVIPDVKSFNNAHSDKRVVVDGRVYEYSDILVEHFTKRLQDVMQNHKKNTTIFLDESCIFIKVVNYLRKRGYTVCRCFDGFWVGKKDVVLERDEIQKIVKNVAKWYFKKFYNHNEVSQTEVISLQASNQQPSNYISYNNNNNNGSYSYSYSKVVNLTPNGVVNPPLLNTHETYNVDSYMNTTDVDVEVSQIQEETYEEWIPDELTQEQKERIQENCDRSFEWRSV